MNHQPTPPEYPIEFGSLEASSFAGLLHEKYASSKKIILVDENTHDCCLEYLITAFPGLSEAEVMLLPAGEENKVMEVCFQVWEAFSEYKISRKDLVINLGGGVVTDMGGFIASVYKRGIDFIHIPTSLLAMADASIGGKTGIDLGRHKNQLGVFSNPVALYIDPAFLHTLPAAEMLNGFAEMLKHGLIADREHWNDLKKMDPARDFPLELLRASAGIKQQIVAADPLEEGERKKLNFGHTFGHAIEGFLLGSGRRLSHGHAVAVGMLCETFLSKEKGMLSQADFDEICGFLAGIYPVPDLHTDEFESLYQLMLNDKKNSSGSIRAVLLEGIGSCRIDIEINREEVIKALSWLVVG